VLFHLKDLSFYGKVIAVLIDKYINPETAREFSLRRMVKKSLARISQCAVKGVLFPVSAKPTWQLSLRPEAPGAVQGGNELS
jgi:hypothetical protein